MTSSLFSLIKCTCNMFVCFWKANVRNCCKFLGKENAQLLNYNVKKVKIV
jgi:hypothetical protein